MTKGARTRTVETDRAQGAPAGKLAAIAGEMRERLATGQVTALHRPLPQGLQIVLERQGGQWRLALGREGVYPSATEVEVCRRAFHAPAGVEAVPREATYRHPKSGRAIRYLVVELRWLEAEALSQAA